MARGWHKANEPWRKLERRHHAVGQPSDGNVCRSDAPVECGSTPGSTGTPFVTGAGTEIGSSPLRSDVF